MSKNRETEPITIHFGDVIESLMQKKERYVIVDVGEGDYVHGLHVYEKDKQVALGELRGSFERADIENIIDRWNLEQILAALAVHVGTTDQSKPIFASVKKNAEQKARVISPATF